MSLEKTTLNKFPAAWDDKKVQDVIAHYEAQSEEAAMLEDEAGVENPDTVMSVPHELVPMVRALIAKKSK